MEINHIFLRIEKTVYFLRKNAILLHARGNPCILQIVFSKNVEGIT